MAEIYQTSVAQLSVNLTDYLMRVRGEILMRHCHRHIPQNDYEKLGSILYKIGGKAGWLSS
jgi:hypothetical protein